MGGDGLAAEIGGFRVVGNDLRVAQAVAPGRGDETFLDGAKGLLRHRVGPARQWLGTPFGQSLVFRWPGGIDATLGI